ncbi:sulfotransferase domain-containing protein [Thiolapillus sp.]
MRILVTGQPASGLFVLAALLRRLYGLNDLNAAQGKPPADEQALADLIREGHFPDQSLLAWHYSAESELLQACREHQVQVVCVSRNPYIVFETLYVHANGSRGMPSVPEAVRIKDAPLDGAEVGSFIEEVFARHLQLPVSWLGSHQARMVRQESLVAEPDQVVQSLSDWLGEVPPEERASAISEVMDSHALGSVGNPLSDSRLPPSTICILNQVIPDGFAELGYVQLPCEPEAVMNARVHGFARFLDLYTEQQRVFLVGHGKSGTTWLHMLFFHHPNAAVVAERRLFEHPDQNQALLDDLLNDDWFESWFHSSSFGVTAPEQTGVRYELSRLMSDYLLYRALAVRKTAKGFERNTPITHFSEKIALNTEQDAQVTIDTLKKLYPDARIVHIVRDPRDVAVSAMFHSYRNFREQHERNWITDFVDSVLEGNNDNILKKKAVSAYFRNHAKAWNRIASIFHQSGEALYGDNYLLVRYEDLLQAPHEQVSRLFAFAGLAHDEPLVEEVVEKASFKNLSKGRKAGEQDSSSFYRKGVAGDWKNYLTPETSRKVFKDAWDLMQQFGYE